MLDPPAYPGTLSPTRSYDFDSAGFRLRVHSWGDPAAQPIVLCHGMWDHARGFDLLAPLLAQRLHVLALDARGHGDSDWADYYTWAPDVQDIVRFARSLGRPVHLLGHSKGGSQVTDAAVAAPELVRKLINIEGFGPPKEGYTVPGGGLRTFDALETMRGFLDASRRSADRAQWRPYASLDHLVARRQALNPRLSPSTWVSTGSTWWSLRTTRWPTCRLESRRRRRSY